MKQIIIKNTWADCVEHGWGNGYVILPKGHQFHGVDYDHIHVQVHGGLTCSEVLTKELLKRFKESPEAETSELSEDDIGSWVVGFDTCHFQDNQINWPKEKVLEETIRLESQLS